MNELPNVDKFGPLTEAEIAGVPAFEDAKPDKSECVMPVPADAPPLPESFKGLGQTSARWEYRGAAGDLLFEIWRFDPSEGKEFRPLSLLRDPAGLRWRWKGVPEPRPLYGLDWLAARPDAPVVICEGEKAADAGAKRLRYFAGWLSSGLESRLVAPCWAQGNNLARRR